MSSEYAERNIVSIPKRVSEALKQLVLVVLVKPVEFQSLKGFQRL